MIVLSVMGKVPPMGTFNTIGLIAALTFIGLWVALPFITMIEKKLKD
jgi:ubiquinol-cytochrome c reductase cytochrome b subunit